MPEYATEGGKLYLAEALFSQLKYIIRCPKCAGIPGKSGFNLDSAGKPDRSGLCRRAWSCTWSNSSKARRAGERRCRRLQVTDFILLAKKSISNAAFTDIVEKVCQRLDPLALQESVLRAYITVLGSNTSDRQSLQPTISLQHLPSPLTTPSISNTILSTRLSSTPCTSDPPSVEEATTKVEQIVLDNASLGVVSPFRTPTLRPLASQDIIDLPLGFDSDDLPIRNPRPNKRRAASDTDLDQHYSSYRRLQSLSAIRRLWQQKRDDIEQEDDINLSLPRLPSTPNIVPDSSATFTNLSTSPTIRTIQLQQKTPSQLRQYNTKRPRKKARAATKRIQRC